jgi:hypothetical protein
VCHVVGHARCDSAIELLAQLADQFLQPPQKHIVRQRLVPPTSRCSSTAWLAHVLQHTNCSGDNPVVNKQMRCLVDLSVRTGVDLCAALRVIRLLVDDAGGVDDGVDEDGKDGE